TGWHTRIRSSTTAPVPGPGAHKIADQLAVPPSCVKLKRHSPSFRRLHRCPFPHRSGEKHGTNEPSGRNRFSNQSQDWPLVRHDDPAHSIRLSAIAHFLD